MSAEDPNVRLSESGGTMRRVGRLPSTENDAVATGLDLSPLEALRRTDQPGPYLLSGAPPYFPAGTVITWHYGLTTHPLRVVRDDARGLVAWLPAGSQIIQNVPIDGSAFRDRPPAERFQVEQVLRPSRWRGSTLRIAPTARPWSVWLFWDDTGRFEGHYLNLELPLLRPASGEPRVHTSDLILDLWLEQEELWVKDEDELDAARDSGRYTADQVALVRAIADLAQRETVAPRAWPLDEGWETWRPPAGWDEPLRLPR